MFRKVHTLNLFSLTANRLYINYSFRVTSRNIFSTSHGYLQCCTKIHQSYSTCNLTSLDTFHNTSSNFSSNQNLAVLYSNYKSLCSIFFFFTNSPDSSHERQHLGTEPWTFQHLSATAGTLWHSCIQPQVRDREVEQLLQWRSWRLSFLFSPSAHTDHCCSRKGFERFSLRGSCSFGRRSKWQLFSLISPFIARDVFSCHPRRLLWPLLKTWVMTWKVVYKIW